MSGRRRGETPPGAAPPPAEYEFVDDLAGIGGAEIVDEAGEPLDLPLGWAVTGEIGG